MLKQGMLLSIAILFLGLVLSGCATTTSHPSSSPGASLDDNSLRVGVTPNYPPLIFKEKGEIVGLEADLARALASSIGKDVRFVELPWGNLIPALLENRIDIIMSGMSITGPRNVRIAFSEPYMEAGQIALIRKTDVNKYRPNSALKSAKAIIGVVQGTTAQYLVEDTFDYGKLVLYQNPVDAVRDVQEKKIDLLIYDYPFVLWYAAKNEARELDATRVPLTDENFAWGIRPGNDSLLRSANKFIQTWKEDGQLLKTIRHWLPYYY